MCFLILRPYIIKFSMEHNLMLRSHGGGQLNLCTDTSKTNEYASLPSGLVLLRIALPCTLKLQIATLLSLETNVNKITFRNIFSKSNLIIMVLPSLGTHESVLLRAQHPETVESIASWVHEGFQQVQLQNGWVGL